MRRLQLKRLAAILSFALILTFISIAPAQSTPPDKVLEGTLTGEQNQTYFEVPFDVPAHIHRISVDFSYTGKEQHTVMDLGIADPERFRGNSGGNKSHFTLSETDATPSYLPGVILAGKWKLLVSVPNIRSTEQSHYRAEIRFNAPAEEYSFALTPLATGKRWYRGDLHMHTAHSDGSCASQSGKRVPCPLFLSAQTAAERGLDFIAITDHNTDSHYDAERELQPYFDKLLLIPGREMTTFWGHFNIFGVTEFVDYRAVPKGSLDINGILRDVRAKGGIASVNHADSPTGEICMGCGWTPPSDVDMSLFTSVEVINGGRIFLSSADFWDRQLAKGIELTAIGGSDNHNAPAAPGTPGAIGWPTTVVEANDLSVSSILDGIRHGRVFIDLTASHDRVIDMEAQNGDNTVRMGGTLQASSGEAIAFNIHVENCPRSTIHLLLDGKESSALPPIPTQSGNESLPFRWTSDGHTHWLRAELRDSNDSLALVSNPIFIRSETNATTHATTH
jgi:hypothetical protein